MEQSFDGGLAAKSMAPILMAEDRAANSREAAAEDARFAHT
jgi:hypothetical protein